MRISDWMSDVCSSDRISRELVMSIGGERFSGVVTPNAIHDALIAVGTGSFVILEAGPETYIQTASRHGGYIVEKREGGRFGHFRALRCTDNLRLGRESGVAGREVSVAVDSVGGESIQ